MESQRLSFWQIWNMSFGFLGIQFGWGLQMANMSAIYQYLGAEESEIPLLWLAAPITGLLVQPIIGYKSDRTWTRLGRRRPYFLVGAVLASLALIAMPNSSSLWMAAGLLWILDASVNVSMEPFRAFVGDLLPEDQRKTGFAMQSLLIGLGAVAASSLPWLFTNVFGLASGAAEGSAIPLSVKLSFYIGSVIFFVAVLYTVLTTKEKPPADLEAFEEEKRKSAGVGHMFSEIFQGIFSMPKAMKQLSVAQFFTWLGLFCLWLYFTPAVATRLFGGVVGDADYQKGVEWAGVCLSAYNFIAFLFSFALIALTKRFSAKGIHTVCLTLGAVGLVSTNFISSPELLLVSMVGVGIAWASILSMPYAMLSNVIPGTKMGFYMGVFNFFIVIPQIVASLGLGPIVKHLLANDASLAVVAGGIAFLVAAFSLRFVEENR
ncbi:MFS transporter [Pelagicoccus sp. SDUM812003]|uniref:MFS transporter n=1 Tax=Pelagicoccus sp. SDUM812003 TaxID=3041267 RepID=UPI00280DEC24|nr:MFS transporter [Pelagicoccus sp. SDUM812003]MDQ8202906.1 MFS transporter [Pelagicoccus sp. SDUM812003]